MIALKHEHRNSTQRAESRIDLLRDVIKKMERGARGGIAREE